MSSYDICDYSNIFNVVAFDDLSEDNVSFDFTDDFLNQTGIRTEGIVNTEPKECHISLIPKNADENIIPWVFPNAYTRNSFYVGKKIKIEQHYLAKEVSGTSSIWMAKTRYWEMVISSVGYKQSSKMPTIEINAYMMPKRTTQNYTDNRYHYYIHKNDLPFYGMYLSDITIKTEVNQEGSLAVEYADSSKKLLIELLNLTWTGGDLNIDPEGKVTFNNCGELRRVKGSVFIPPYSTNSKIDYLHIYSNKSFNFALNGMNYYI